MPPTAATTPKLPPHAVTETPRLQAARRRVRVVRPTTSRRKDPWEGYDSGFTKAPPLPAETRPQAKAAQAATLPQREERPRAEATGAEAEVAAKPTPLAVRPPPPAPAAAAVAAPNPPQAHALVRAGRALRRAPGKAPWLTGSLLGAAVGAAALFPFALAPLAYGLLVAGSGLASGALMRTAVQPRRHAAGAKNAPAHDSTTAHPFGAVAKQAAEPAPTIADAVTHPTSTAVVSGILTGAGILAAGAALPVAAAAGLVAAVGWGLGLDAVRARNTVAANGLPSRGLAERSALAAAHVANKVWHRPILVGVLTGAATLGASMAIPAYAATVLATKLAVSTTAGLTAMTCSFLATADARHISRAAAGATLAGVVSSGWLGLGGASAAVAVGYGAAAAATVGVAVYILSAMGPVQRILLLGALALGLGGWAVWMGLSSGALLAQLQKLKEAAKEVEHG